MTIETVVVPLGRNGKYGQLTVNRADLPEVSDDHIWMYGIRQCLNDAIADKTDDGGAALPIVELIAKAQKRLDALMRGELRVRSGEAEPVDPVEAEAYRLAWAKVVEHVKTLPEFKESKGEKDRVLFTIGLRAERAGREAPDRETVITAMLEKSPDIRKAAERIVRERGKVPAELGIEI